MRRIKLGNQVQKAYDKLLEMIITLELKPGQVIVESDLEERTGFGRTPIREALLLLKQDYFVERSPYKSGYIAEISLVEAKALFETLALVDKNINLIALTRVTAQELAAIEEACNRIDAAIESRNQWQISSANIEFHNLIYLSSKNKYMIKFAKIVRKHTERLSHITYRGSKDMFSLNTKNYDELMTFHHKEIVRCLKDKDSVGLENITIEHLQFFQRSVLNFLYESDTLFLLKT